MNTEEKMPSISLSQDAYLRGLTKLLRDTDSLYETDDGTVSYTTRYKLSNSGYNGDYMHRA